MSFCRKLGLRHVPTACRVRAKATCKESPRTALSFLTALSSAAAETYDPAGQAQKVLHSIHRLCTACFKFCVVRRTAQACSQFPVGVLQIAVASGTSKQKNPAASARCANPCDRLHSSVSHGAGHCQFRRRKHRWSPRKGREKPIATTEYDGLVVKTCAGYFENGPSESSWLLRVGDYKKTVRLGLWGRLNAPNMLAAVWSAAKVEAQGDRA
jgi:hypothetical protein